MTRLNGSRRERGLRSRNNWHNALRCTVFRDKNGFARISEKRGEDHEVVSVLLELDR